MLFSLHGHINQLTRIRPEYNNPDSFRMLSRQDEEGPFPNEKTNLLSISWQKHHKMQYPNHTYDWQNSRDSQYIIGVIRKSRSVNQQI